MRVEVKVTGVVQGVGFRPFVYRIATKNGLVGYVRNRGDAVVEIVVEGEEKNIQNFLKDLKEQAPPLARIHEVITRHAADSNKFKAFTILASVKNVELSGSVIPPDIAICNECLSELRNPNDKRHNYFFITCTNCGPRYTVIERLPYDRANTTMRDFHMCEFCKKEYSNPANRRFHAQTIACDECGPKVYLTTSDGQLVECEDPVREAGRLLEESFVVAIKGYGGFHVATATTKSEPIVRIRKVKHRSQKPFAIMARNLEAVRSFAEVSLEEEQLLTSPARPIVLLNKSEDYYLSELIAPGLHNIGVMLPYTGLHVMLFDDVCEPAFVMTSANPPSEPIVKDDEEALKRLGGVVDYFLFHNRKIAQRCDDSVVRVHGKHQSLIRRSRGYAPAPIRLKNPTSHCILGLGAEENVTACLLLRDKAFLSQFIGDVENLETLRFLRKTIRSLVKLTNSQVEIVACDFHPRFTTTKLAYELGKTLGCPVVQVQHHHAHAAALMAEHGVNELVGIVCDGYGYGLDGAAWGGEIIYCNINMFERLGHLQEQPMIGGDLATRYPLRMVAGILHDIAQIEDWLMSKSRYFPHGEKEVEVMLRQLKGKVTQKTTSCGRVLDAVSAILDICYERTYEGEPAMKLESAARKGEDVLNLEPVIKGNVINTTILVREIYRKRNYYLTADLAFSAQSYVARSLAQLAIKEAERLNVRNIGFTGGVAYNEHITQTIRKIVEKAGFKFLVHEAVPPGDGGISFGQAVAASFIYH